MIESPFPELTIRTGVHQKIPWAVCMGPVSINGYVKTRLLTEREMDSLNVHGGITYGTGHWSAADSEKDWIGFDTGHYGDLCDLSSVLAAGFEPSKEVRDGVAYMNRQYRSSRFERLWTVEDVVTEAIKLAEQVAILTCRG